MFMAPAPGLPGKLYFNILPKSKWFRKTYKYGLHTAHLLHLWNNQKGAFQTKIIKKKKKKEKTSLVPIRLKAYSPA